MSIQSVSNPNISSRNMTATRPDSSHVVSDGSALRVVDAQEKAPAKVKIGAALGTLTGVAAAMLWTFKSKSPNIENIKDIKGLKNIGDYFHNLITVVYKDETKDKKDTWEMEKLIGRLTLGSVGGGLLGGSITDKKENFKAKLRETVIQVIGNIFTPLLCVDGGMKVFENLFEDKLKNAKCLEGKSNLIKGAPKTAFSLACLVGGLLLGNKVGNTINKTIFRVDDKRKIKVSDLSPQIDDACVAVSFFASESPIGTMVKRIIPVALMVAGYSTGVTQECPKRLKSKEECKIPKNIENSAA